MNLSGIHATREDEGGAPPDYDLHNNNNNNNNRTSAWSDRRPAFSLDALFSDQEPGTILLAVMYGVSFAAGLGGNVTALLALTRRRRRQPSGGSASATRRLLVNLAVCDMLVVCVCMPVNLCHQVYRSAWVLGPFLCRAVPFVQAVSVAASVLSLAAVCLNRYYCVSSPLHARSFFTGRRVLAMIAAVWAVSSALCLPLLFASATRALSLPLPGDGEGGGGGDRTVTLCVEGWSQAGVRQGYNLLLFCCLYCFPVAFNLVLSCLTSWRLWGGADHKLSEGSGGRGGGANAQIASRIRMRKRIAKMVLSLVLLFTLSWLPLYAVDIWIDFNMPDSQGEGEEGGEAGGSGWGWGEANHVQHGWVLQGRPFAQWLGLTNSALNPLCYCFVGNLHRTARRFRQSYRDKLSSVFSLSLQPSVCGFEGKAAGPAGARTSSRTPSRTPSCTPQEATAASKVYTTGNNLAKSKSLSVVTVCETVFD